MKVAIDGPAGSGKSTIAKELARRYGFTLIDTGAMYRSVTLVAQREGKDIHDAEAMSEIAHRIRISFFTADDGSQMVFVDGENVTDAIRTPEVDRWVSEVSAYPEVRRALVESQRKLAGEVDVVAEGRDIGTVVFPDAEVKVFLTADPQARAHRRALQRDVHSVDEESKILEDLVRRDDEDSSRETSPLRAAADAFVMDSTSMSIDEEVTKISELIEEARKSAQAASAQEDVRTEAPAIDEAQFEKPEHTQDAPQKKEDGESEVRHGETEAPHAEAKRTTRAKSDEPMRSFVNYSPEDYYDHGVRDFPVGARLILGTAVSVCGGVTKILWPWKVENGQELWDSDCGRVVVMNHESMMDPVIVVCSDYFHGRRMRPIYKSELDDVPVLRWLLARVGAIPVERGKADIKCVRRAQRALERGEDVLVFPEGTRIHSDDQEIELHAGFALMAQLAKAPVLPMAIVGAREGTIGGNPPLRPGRIYMAVGDPITFDEIEVKGRKKQAKEMEARAMRAVYALRDRLRRDHPGKM